MSVNVLTQLSNVWNNDVCLSRRPLSMCGKLEKMKEQTGGERRREHFLLCRLK